MKKTLSILLIVATLLGMFIVPVSAASSDFDFDDVSSSNSISLYASEKITTYSNKTLSSRAGSIYKDDLVKITRVYDNEIARVEYPVASGKKRAYVALDALFEDCDDWESFTADDKIKVYRASNLAKSFGTVYAEDRCWLIDETSSRASFILYPIGKGFKAGYVNTEDIESLLGKKSGSSASKKRDSNASIMYNVPHFEQDDPDWSKIVLNQNAPTKRTIGSHGCTTTAAAMMASYYIKREVTPDAIVNSASYTRDNLLVWGSLPIDVTLKTYNKTMSSSIRKDLLELLEEGPVIIGAAKNSSGSRQHWCIVVGLDGDPDNPRNNDFVVLDPAKSSSSTSTLNDFLQNRTFIQRLVYVN